MRHLFLPMRCRRPLFECTYVYYQWFSAWRWSKASKQRSFLVFLPETAETTPNIRGKAPVKIFMPEDEGSLGNFHIPLGRRYQFFFLMLVRPSLQTLRGETSFQFIKWPPPDFERIGNYFLLKCTNRLLSSTNKKMS